MLRQLRQFAIQQAVEVRTSPRLRRDGLSFRKGCNAKKKSHGATASLQFRRKRFHTVLFRPHVPSHQEIDQQGALHTTFRSRHPLAPHPNPPERVGRCFGLCFDSRKWCQGIADIAAEHARQMARGRTSGGAFGGFRVWKKTWGIGKDDEHV